MYFECAGNTELQYRELLQLIATLRTLPLLGISNVYSAIHNTEYTSEPMRL